VLPLDVNNIFSNAPSLFNQTALDLYAYQYSANKVYQRWCDLIIPAEHPKNEAGVPVMDHYTQIPAMPIGFFKTETVQTGNYEPVLYFESSGTTGTEQSKHYIKDESLYQQSFMTAFEAVYGPIQNWCIIGLLPAYLERPHSSLVYMVEHLIKASNNAQSGFYLYDHEALSQTLKANEAAGQKTLLIGVTFALLDFAAKFQMPLEHTTILETGGMKGRRKELTREEVHVELMDAFKVKSIHGEYGMTELLSQAYATGNGMYKCPPWMRVLVTEEEDPLTVKTSGRGTLQVIDLANVHSCSFIATEDVGAVYADGSFEVFGRMDHSALRGCSLMVL
jgi:Acyl-protein synthetase, LuxE